MFELGNNLREARLHNRIDLVAAEQDTKIRSKYLAALEEEEFEVLPGPVYIRGFLRTYSRYLGLDPQRFIDEYNARFGRFEDVEEDTIPALGRPSLAMEHESRGRRNLRAVTLLVLCAVAVVVWLGLRSADRELEASSAPTHTARSVPAQLPTEKTESGSLEDAAKNAAGAKPNNADSEAAAKTK